AGLERLIDRLAAGNAGGGEFHRPGLVRSDRPFTVERIAQRIDHAADEGVADGNVQQHAEGADLVAFADLQVIAEDDDDDRMLFEIERHAADAGAGELDHLRAHDAGEAVDPGDAVADVEDAADFPEIQLGFVALDLSLQY